MKRYIKSAVVDVHNEDMYDRCAIASAHTDPAVLESLKDDRRPEVIKALCSNPNLPLSIIEEFARARDYEKRRGIASNPSTPVDILDSLKNDPCDYVQVDLVRNPNTPHDTLKYMAEHCHNLYVAEAFVNGKSNSIPLDVIEALLYSWAGVHSYSIRVQCKELLGRT